MLWVPLFIVHPAACHPQVCQPYRCHCGGRQVHPWYLHQPDPEGFQGASSLNCGGSTDWPPGKSLWLPVPACMHVKVWVSGMVRLGEACSDSQRVCSSCSLWRRPHTWTFLWLPSVTPTLHWRILTSPFPATATWVYQMTVKLAFIGAELAGAISDEWQWWWDACMTCPMWTCRPSTRLVWCGGSWLGKCWG